MQPIKTPLTLFYISLSTCCKICDHFCGCIDPRRVWGGGFEEDHPFFTFFYSFLQLPAKLSSARSALYDNIYFITPPVFVFEYSLVCQVPKFIGGPPPGPPSAFSGFLFFPFSFLFLFVSPRRQVTASEKASPLTPLEGGS